MATAAEHLIFTDKTSFDTAWAIGWEAGSSRTSGQVLGGLGGIAENFCPDSEDPTAVQTNVRGAWDGADKITHTDPESGISIDLCKFDDTSDSNTHYTEETYSIAAAKGQPYRRHSVQFFAAVGEWSRVRLFLEFAASTVSIDVNLNDGTTIASGAKLLASDVTLIDAGAKVYRIAIEGLEGDGTDITAQAFILNDSAATSFAGDGTKGVYMSGLMVNRGSRQPWLETTGTLVEGHQGDFGWSPENRLDSPSDLTDASVTTNNCTVTSGQSDPDGGTDADELKATGDATIPIVQHTDDFGESGRGVSSLRVVAKKGTTDFLHMIIWDDAATSTGADCWFDLNLGTILTNASGTRWNLLDKTIVSKGSGWYECWISVEDTDTFSATDPTASFGPTSADATDDADVNDTVIIFEPQWNRGRHKPEQHVGGTGAGPFYGFGCSYRLNNGVVGEGLYVQPGYTNLDSQVDEPDYAMSEWSGLNTGYSTHTSDQARGGFGGQSADNHQRGSNWSWTIFYNTIAVATAKPTICQFILSYADPGQAWQTEHLYDNNTSSFNFAYQMDSDDLVVGGALPSQNWVVEVGDGRVMLCAREDTSTNTGMKHYFSPTNYGVSQQWDLNIGDFLCANDDGDWWRYPLPNEGTGSIALADDDTQRTIGDGTARADRQTVVIEFTPRSDKGADYGSTVIWSLWDDSSVENYLKVRFRNVSGTPRLTLSRKDGTTLDDADHATDLVAETTVRVAVTWDGSDGRIAQTNGTAVDKIWISGAPSGLDREGLGRYDAECVGAPLFVRQVARYDVRATETELDNLVDLTVDLSTATVGQELLPTGLATGTAFGVPTVANDGVILLATGLASGAAYGAPQLGWGLVPAAFASAFAAGVPAVLGGDQTLFTMEVLPGAAFGVPVFTIDPRSFRYWRWKVLRITATSAKEHAIREMNLVQSGVDYPVAAMTSHNTPLPLVASSPHERASDPVWDAFSATEQDYQSSGSNLSDSNGYFAEEWVQLDLGAGNGIHPTSMKLKIRDTTKTMRDYDVLASNLDDFEVEGTTSIVFSSHRDDTSWNFGTDNIRQLARWLEPPSFQVTLKTGNPSVVGLGVTLTPSGVASGLTFGVAELDFGTDLFVSGVASAVVIGSNSVTVGAVALTPTGVATGTAAGAATVVLEPIKPLAIAGTLIGNPIVTATPHVIAPGGRFILSPEQASGRAVSAPAYAAGRVVKLATQKSGRTVDVDNLSAGRIARIVEP